MKIHFPTPFQIETPRMYVPHEIALNLVHYEHLWPQSADVDYYLIDSTFQLGVSRRLNWDTLVIRNGSNIDQAESIKFTPEDLDTLIEQGNVVMVQVASTRLAVWTNTGKFTLGIDPKAYEFTDRETIMAEVNPKAKRYAEIPSGDWFHLQSEILVKDGISCVSEKGRFWLPENTLVLPMEECNFALVPGSEALFEDLSIGERFLFCDRPYVKMHVHAAQPGREKLEHLMTTPFAGPELVLRAELPPNCGAFLMATPVALELPAPPAEIVIDMASLPPRQDPAHVHMLTPDMISSQKGQDEQLSIQMDAVIEKQGLKNETGPEMVTAENERLLDEIAVSYGYRCYLMPPEYGFCITLPWGMGKDDCTFRGTNLNELIPLAHKAITAHEFRLPESGVYYVRLTDEEKAKATHPELTHYVYCYDGKPLAIYRLVPGHPAETVYNLDYDAEGIVTTREHSVEYGKTQSEMDEDFEALQIEIKETVGAIVADSGLVLPRIVRIPVRLDPNHLDHWTPRSWHYLHIEKKTQSDVRLTLYELAPGQTAEHVTPPLGSNLLSNLFRDVLKNVPDPEFRDKLVRASDRIGEMIDTGSVDIVTFEALKIGTEFRPLLSGNGPFKKHDAEHALWPSNFNSTWHMDPTTVVVLEQKGLDQLVDSGQNGQDRLVDQIVEEFEGLKNETENEVEPEHYLMLIEHPESNQTRRIVGTRRTDQRLHFLVQRSFPHGWFLSKYSEIEEQALDIFRAVGEEIYELGKDYTNG